MTLALPSDPGDVLANDKVNLSRRGHSAWPRSIRTLAGRCT